MTRQKQGRNTTAANATTDRQQAKTATRRRQATPMQFNFVQAQFNSSSDPLRSNNAMFKEARTHKRKRTADEVVLGGDGGAVVVQVQAPDAGHSVAATESTGRAEPIVQPTTQTEIPQSSVVAPQLLPLVHPAWNAVYVQADEMPPEHLYRLDGYYARPVLQGHCIPIPPYLTPVLLPNQVMRFHLKREFSPACQDIVRQFWKQGGILRMPFYLCTGVPLFELRAEAPYRFCLQSNGSYAYRKNCISEWKSPSEEVELYLQDPLGYHEDIYFDEDHIPLLVPQLNPTGTHMPLNVPQQGSNGEHHAGNVVPKVVPTAGYLSQPVPVGPCGFALPSDPITTAYPRDSAAAQSGFFNATYGYPTQYAAGPAQAALPTEQIFKPWTHMKPPRIMTAIEEAELKLYRLTRRLMITGRFTMTADDMFSEEEPTVNTPASAEGQCCTCGVFSKRGATGESNVAALDEQRGAIAQAKPVAANEHSSATMGSGSSLESTSPASIAAGERGDTLTGFQLNDLSGALSTAAEAECSSNGVRSADDKTMDLFFNFDAFADEEKPCEDDLLSASGDMGVFIPSPEGAYASSTASSTPSSDAPLLGHREMSSQVSKKGKEPAKPYHFGRSAGGSAPGEC